MEGVSGDGDEMMSETPVNFYNLIIQVNSIKCVAFYDPFKWNCSM